MVLLVEIGIHNMSYVMCTKCITIYWPYNLMEVTNEGVPFRVGMLHACFNSDFDHFNKICKHLHFIVAIHSSDVGIGV